MSQYMSLTLIKNKNKNKNTNFYISHSPTNNNLDLFIKSLKKNNIKYLIRLCNQTYDFTCIENENIKCYDLEIIDGSIPTNDIISKWNGIISDINDEKNKRNKENTENTENTEGILVHCIAGLGRAPIMVSIELINDNMDPTDAINYIRKYRSGAFNSRQIEFLLNYKPIKKPSNCWLSFKSKLNYFKFSK